MKKSSSKFKRTTFKNGLTLVTEQVPGVRSLSIGAWIRFGTRFEDPKVCGVSHFLEHMLFKGTKKRNALQLARLLDGVGGDFNAFTAREHTCFHLLLLEKDYRLGLEVLMDVLLNSKLSSVEIERERQVILQEVAMVDDSPEELAHDAFFEMLFEGHGLGKPILGTQKTLKRLKRPELLSHYQNYYHPSQVVISVSGNVSHEAIEKCLGPVKKKQWPKRPVQTPELFRESVPSPSQVEQTWWIEKDTEQVHLVWGGRGPQFQSKDRFAVFLLNAYLGGGMSSLLFQEIREKNGLAYTVYSGLSPFSDSGVFSIYVGTALNQVGRCLSLIEKSIARVQKVGLSFKDLRWMKESLKGAVFLSSDHVESRMLAMGRNELFTGRYLSPEKVCEQIDAVCSEDLKRVSRFLFQDQARQLVALGPKPPKSLLTKLQPVRYLKNYHT